MLACRPLLAVVSCFGFLASTFAQTNGQIYNQNQTSNQNQPANSQIARVIQQPVVRYADDQFAVLAWTTDIATDSRVLYGSDPNNLTRVAEDPAITTAHRVHLTELEPGATIYFQIETGAAQPQIMSFSTPSAGATPLRDARTVVANIARPPAQNAADAQDTIPPNTIVITGGPTIQYADDRSAVITWVTNIASPSAVYYGTTQTNLAQNAFGDTNTMQHRVLLNNLIPATTYYLQVDTGTPQGRVMTFRTSASSTQAVYNQPAQPATTAGANSTTPQLARRIEIPVYAGGTIVPAGTDMQARLETELSTKTSRQGDQFTATLLQLLQGTNGRAAIPAGSRIRGEVSGVEQGKAVAVLRGKARLNLKFTEIVLPNGQSFPIQASLVSMNEKAGSSTNEEGQVSDKTTGREVAKDVGIGAGLGTVAGLIFGSALKGLAIGAIAGGGYVLATQGRDVNIPANAGIVVRLDQALSLPASAIGTAR